ncbi:MAG: hypothetical protein WD845_08825 [Pirellulales bacterium]
MVRSISRQRAWLVSRALACAALFFAAGVAAAGGNPPQDGDRVARLVRQLGSAKFIERQEATRALTELGVAAKEALAEVTNEPDAELRRRARSILATVTQTDFQNRLEAFSADYDGHHQRTLPGWERFAGLFGATQQARQLFVEMAREEPALLEAYAAGDRQASEALHARCQVLLEEFMQVSGRESLFPVGTLATLLLIGSEPDVAVDEQIGGQLYTWMLYQPTFSDNARSGAWSLMMKKLLGRWIVKDTSTSATMQNLIFAASYDLQTDGMTLAKKLLDGETGNAQLRQFALLAVGRFGDKDDLPLVEDFLADSNTCSAIQLSDPPRQVDVQVRDIALGVAIHLSGQQPTEFGAIAVHSSPQSFFKVPALAFAEPAQRAAALKRWSEWRAAHAAP